MKTERGEEGEGNPGIILPAQETGNERFSVGKVISKIGRFVAASITDEIGRRLHSIKRNIPVAGVVAAIGATAYFATEGYPIQEDVIVYSLIAGSLFIAGRMIREGVRR
jgi:hypothetical protein